MRSIYDERVSNKSFESRSWLRYGCWRLYSIICILIKGCPTSNSAMYLEIATLFLFLAISINSHQHRILCYSSESYKENFRFIEFLTKSWRNARIEMGLPQQQNLRCAILNWNLLLRFQNLTFVHLQVSFKNFILALKTQRMAVLYCSS